jgi:alkylphosphonate utilization operon protein PhnA
MSSLPNCPECNSEYTYEDGALYMCPECAHEWPINAAEVNIEAGLIVKIPTQSASDGDDVTVIKDLKVKGSPQGIKAGTKVKGIRLVDSDHNIDCKITGIGPMKLKSEFVKKL